MSQSPIFIISFIGEGGLNITHSYISLGTSVFMFRSLYMHLSQERGLWFIALRKKLIVKATGFTLFNSRIDFHGTQPYPKFRAISLAFISQGIQGWLADNGPTKI